MDYEMTTKHLQDARDLLDEPAKWCKGDLARNDNDDPEIPDAPEAICWCLNGALWAAHPRSDEFCIYDLETSFGTPATQAAQWRLWAAIRERTGFTALGVAAYNDAEKTTYADIIALLDTAINMPEDEFRRAAPHCVRDGDRWKTSWQTS